MSETKWTPGPWEAVQTHDVGGDVYFWIHCPGQPNPVDHEWVIRRKGDANLIAAAPCMYEALEIIFDADGDCIKDGLPRIMPDHIRAKVASVLAKARGETP